MNEGKKLRGFQLLSLEQRSRIASMGGVTAHRKGTAHRFNSEEAKVAARKMLANRKSRKIANYG